MSAVRPLRFVLGVAAAALALSFSSPALGQGKKINTKTVSIPTFDGVTLSGTLYPNPGGKRDAVAVFLHNFDGKKGGSQADTGWGDLAAALHADGYAVLTFDFRGFGDSKNVDKDVFWKEKHNGPMYVTKKGKAPETIDHASFKPAYYPYLVNDLAAVKAYLDRRNDAGEVNSGNVILVGAGDGAAVGTMWLANQARLKRDKSDGTEGLPTLGEPEVRDVAAGVWLSPSSSVGSKTVASSLYRWTEQAGKTSKVPMLFLVAKKDTASDAVATKMYQSIKPQGMPKAKEKEYPHTQIARIADTSLKGSALLDKELGTIKELVGALNKVLEDRGTREVTKRDSIKSRYYYATAKGTVPKLAKPSGKDVGAVDLGALLPGG